MPGSAATPEDYLKEVPEERHEAFSAIRDTINENLPEGFEEGIQYGMVGWFVPHSIYPAGYHCDPKEPLPYIGIANQKRHIGLYLMCVYADEAAREEFVENWKATGAKLDMGKSCVRIKKWDVSTIPLDVIAKAVARNSVQDVIDYYESAVKR
jgi:hypothetical protein